MARYEAYVADQAARKDEIAATRAALLAKSSHPSKEYAAAYPTDKAVAKLGTYPGKGSPTDEEEARHSDFIGTRDAYLAEQYAEHAASPPEPGQPGGQSQTDGQGSKT